MADSEQIDLAKAEGFVLGALRVDPPTLQVAAGETHETLEPRIMQVFVALARRRGEVVSREDLISQCWDGRSVGDDAINRCIGRLRRLSEAAGGFSIETIARVGYRLIETEPPATDAAAAPTRGAPEPAEEAAATTERPNAPDTANPAPPKPIWRRRWWVVAAAVALILAVTAADVWLAHPPSLNRVVVLPLQPLGTSEDARMFGAGVTEQIIGVLSENQVQAVARDEVARWRSSGRDDAAQKLGADFILDGSVQPTPDGLRVIVHLDRASSHLTLWSGTFDQAGVAPAGLQSEVAARVVDEIKAALAAAVVKDDAAVAAYLKAKEFAREGGRTAAMQRHDQMRIVVAHAPDFSLGHSGLAWSSASLAQFADPGDIPALRAEARREADRALALDPHNGEAYLALAALAPPRDYAEQERLFRQGLAVEPDEPTLNSTLASFLEDVGRINEAVTLYERAAVLDPLSPRKNAGFAAAEASAGNISAARATIDRAAKRWPNNINVWSVALMVASYGDRERAEALLKDAPRIAPQFEPSFFAAVNTGITGLLHNTPETRASARRALLAAVATRQFSDASAIEILARLGDVDGAYGLTEPAFFADHANDRYGRPDAAVLLRPSTAALRADQRFLPLVTRLGLVAYWKNHTAPDFCRSEAVAPCPELTQAAKR